MSGMQSQELQYIPDTVWQEDYLTPRAGSGLQQAGCDFCPQSKHTQLRCGLSRTASSRVSLMKMTYNGRHTGSRLQTCTQNNSWAITLFPSVLVMKWPAEQTASSRVRITQLSLEFITSHPSLHCNKMFKAFFFFLQLLAKQNDSR